MKSSKRRELAPGDQLKALHMKMRMGAYEKLAAMAGTESIVATVERMTDFCFERAQRKRRDVHVEK